MLIISCGVDTIDTIDKSHASALWTLDKNIQGELSKSETCRKQTSQADTRVRFN